MMSTRFRDHAAPLIIVLGMVAAQLVLIAQPTLFLVTNLLPDDAFYYFQIARHIAGGEGSTFDGVNLTNGYHPLWMLILIPLFSLFSVGGTNDVLPIQIALMLSVFVNAATALIVYRLTAFVTEVRAARIFALVLWCFNPFLLYESLNGLETSLSLFFLAAITLYALKLPKVASMWNLMALGVLGGLMALSRMDLVFYFIALLLWLVARSGIKQGIRDAFIVGSVATVVVSPWFIWNYLTFGMFLTSASEGNTIINHTLVESDNGAGLLTTLKATVYLLLFHLKETLLRTGAPWVVFALAGVAALLLLRSKELVAQIRTNRPVLLALFGGFILLFVVNAGLRFTGRTWYFVSFNLFLVLLAAWTVGKVWPEIAYKRFTTVLALTAVLGTFLLTWYQQMPDRFSNQGGMLEMAQYMSETLPAGTPVGVFNAGVQGYFSTVRVINLDGLVNNQAFEAIRDKRLWSYIAKDEGLTYISDFEIYLSYRYRPFFDTPDVFTKLSPLHTIYFDVDHRGTNSITLYQVGE